MTGAQYGNAFPILACASVSSANFHVFYVFFVVTRNTVLNKQLRYWWFECHANVLVCDISRKHHMGFMKCEMLTMAMGILQLAFLLLVGMIQECESIKIRISRNLNTIPSYSPVNVTDLDFSSNNFSIIKPGDFRPSPTINVSRVNIKKKKNWLCDLFAYFQCSMGLGRSCYRHVWCGCPSVVNLWLILAKIGIPICGNKTILLCYLTFLSPQWYFK